MKTTEEFIIKAKKIHGDKYDYTDSIYTNYKNKIKIKCFEHGYFFTTWDCHISSSAGCAKCGYIKISLNKTNSTEDFIKKSNEIHHNKYDYSKSNYIGCDKKIEIICKVHGSFYQVPMYHLRGSGCSQCGIKTNQKNRAKGLKEFLLEAEKLYKDTYDYTLVNYVNNKIHVKIICKLHGIFETSPTHHLRRNVGCQKCKLEKTAKLRIKPFDIFISECNQVHNFKYDYSKIVYVKGSEKVIIGCPKHGDFEQTALYHLYGTGCAKCTSSISKIEIKWLDYIGVKEKYRHKTIFLNGKRFNLDAFDSVTNTIYEFYGDYWHGNPDVFDHNKVHPIRKVTYGEIYSKTINRESILKKAGYNLITIWENDFNKILNTKTNNRKNKKVVKN